MMNYYVYILQSIKNPDRHYIGRTTDIEKRLKKHNEGGSPYTSQYKPWKLQTTITFTEKQKAIDFEIHLKSHSGRAFSKKHF